MADSDTLEFRRNLNLNIIYDEMVYLKKDETQLALGGPKVP